MFAPEWQLLQRLAVLAMLHNLAVCQIISHYAMIQSPASWLEARDFCRRHYVDLAVLSTEEEYFTLLNATAGDKASFWLGLQRQNIFSGWKWVDGDELSYEHWFRINYGGRCASLEAVLEKKEKLLARYCEELHMFVCQGPVSPQPVTLDSVSSDEVVLSWNVSAFMQTTPHRYNVTTCADTCDTLLFPYTDGSAFMTVNISNLTSATEYFIEISAVVVRPDGVTGENVTLHSDPTGLQVKTVDSDDGQVKVVIVILKVLKFVSVLPSLWVVCHLLRKDVKESEIVVSPVELLAEDIFSHLIPEKHPEIKV